MLSNCTHLNLCDCGVSSPSILTARLAYSASGAHRGSLCCPVCILVLGLNLCTDQHKHLIACLQVPSRPV